MKAMDIDNLEDRSFEDEYEDEIQYLEDRMLTY